MARSAQDRPLIGITLGDHNGVGPEVTLKALRAAALLDRAGFVLIGSIDALRVHADAIGEDRPIRSIAHPDDLGDAEPGLAVLDVGEGGVSVDFGRTEAGAGRVAMRAVERAVDLCLEGALDGMVTAPISKQAVNEAGYAIPGHTEFLAERTRAEGYTMMMVSDGLRVGLVTTHIPVSEIAENITREAILEKIDIITASLRLDFGLATPRIAVLGLNPHAGDGGVLGREEIECIAPAVREARTADRIVEGPFPADGFFGTGSQARFDAVLAMYHDQGLVPFKTLSFNRGVNFTAGLPIVRTSPDHGTAFDIAGQNRAEPASMRYAVALAIDVARRRAAARA